MPLSEPRFGDVTFADPGAAPDWLWQEMTAFVVLVIVLALGGAASWWIFRRGGASMALYLVPAGLMLGALGPWPYAYYQVLRLITLGCLGFVLYRMLPWQWTWRRGVLAVVLVIYNPVFPLHFPREVWAVINVITATALLAVAYWVTRPPSAREVDAVISRLSQPPDHRQ